MLNQLAAVNPPPGGTGAPSGQITNPLLGILRGRSGLSFFQGFIPAIITLAFVIGTIIFFFTFIIGAIQYISSGGDKAAVESARGKLGNAIVGLILLFATFAVIKVIEIFFGIDILVLDIDTLKIP